MQDKNGLKLFVNESSRSREDSFNVQPSSDLIKGMDFFKTKDNEFMVNTNIIRKLIIENNETIKRQKFRFNEIDYKYVLRFDLLMFALQIVISILYIGSWFTFLLVRVPRVVVSCCVGSCTMKISDLDRRMKCLRAE